MPMQTMLRRFEDNVVCADFRADAAPRREPVMLIERLTICLSQQGDRFFWEILDWLGKPMLGCAEVDHQDGYASFNAAWAAAVDQASQIAARANAEYQRRSMEE
jgi:hypothetical protein